MGLYGRVVQQARLDVFYKDHGVPDTLDGRYEMVALHMVLVLRRMRRSPDLASVAQELFDLMFQDMDRTLREMGVGDLRVGVKVKDMAKGLYGRIAAYGDGLDGVVPMQHALRRNLFGTVEAAEQHLVTLAGYVRRCADLLDEQSDASLASGAVSFAEIRE